MKTLIPVADAKALVSGSDERKEVLIGLVNNTIQSQAQQGLYWAHFPTSATDIEIEWLKEELTLAGYTISGDHPKITW